jgi:hypothetical protein
MMYYWLWKFIGFTSLVDSWFMASCFGLCFLLQYLVVSVPINKPRLLRILVEWQLDSKASF